MKKTAVIAIGVVVALGIADYFFRFHTYFRRVEVHDSLPNPSVSAVASRTVVRGSFMNADLVHRGSGTARIIENGPIRYLRLENFQVTNGPDLYVYLSQSKTPTGDIKSLDNYIILGRLKGNAGDQTYEIPKPVEGYDTVVIWCQKFDVLFAYAIME